MTVPLPKSLKSAFKFYLVYFATFYPRRKLLRGPLITQFGMIAGVRLNS